MRILVLYFAAAREAAGLESEPVNLPEGSTVAGLVDAVVNAHPPLARLATSLRAAVGERFAPSTQVLEAGDTVALLPPASGG